MKSKKILTLALASMLLCSCGNGGETSKPVSSTETSGGSASSTESQSQQKEISCDYSSIAGLPNKSYELKINNDTGEQLIVTVGDNKYDLISTSVRGMDKIAIEFLKEGTGYIEVRTASASPIRIDVESVDLSITNESDNIPVGTSEKITLSHNVEATYEIDDETVASIDEEGTITSLKEGEFNVKVTYGFIELTKAFDSYEKIAALTKLNRDNPKIKWIGRVYNGDGVVELNNGASGFEVVINGTELKASMSGWFGSWYGATKLSVYVDDEAEARNIVTIDKATTTETYTLISGLEKGTHTIRVTKRTEGLSTSWNLYGITTDGYFKNADKSRRLRIEAYGDSISAGYGNLRGNIPDTTSSEYQDANQTWATYTAKNLNADINVIARSGIGLYTSSGIDESLQMKVVGKCVNLDGEKAWNHDNYKPDLVMINLGTNDNWDSRFNLDTFKTEYVSFVKDLSTRYGDDVPFVLASGFMEVAVNPYLVSIKELLNNQVANPVEVFKFDKCLDGHPVASEHLAGAAKLTSFIKEKGFDQYKEDPTPEPLPSPTGEDCNVNLDIELPDVIPSYLKVGVKVGNGDYQLLEQEGDFHFTKDMVLPSSDVEMTIGLTNGEEYGNEPQTKTVSVRKDGKVVVKMDSFSAFPEDITPDPDFGWKMSSHIFDASMTIADDKTVDYTNSSNWMAGFAYRASKTKKNTSLKAHIKVDSAITAETYIGMCPYYVDDLNFIVVYFQWRAGGVFGGVGCTGLISGNNIGWNDFASFASVSCPVNEGVDLQVDRNSTQITVTFAGISQSQQFYRIKDESANYGLYAQCSQTVHYTNVVESESSLPAPSKWSISPCLFSEELTVLSDTAVKLSNFNNWLAGMVLTRSDAEDRYSVSAKITSSKDSFVASEDVQIALVPYYQDANNFTLLYLQWNDMGAIKSIGCTGYRDGTWTGWDDLWDFAGVGSHLLTGDTFTVSRNADVLTVSYGGLTVNKKVMNMNENYAYGFWCHNCVATFSNITYNVF
ncbi:MAG: GDSL-type esterase/lipase family protein [Bacilli bacterium]|nr:GDSL-type esterase/lipase family protein [Bacilli bacterium]